MTTSVIQLVGPDHGVALEQMLLKTGMVLPGAKSAEHADAGLVAQATLRSLQASVPAAVPGVVFLSGGQSEQAATQRLNSISATNDTHYLAGRVAFFLVISYSDIMENGASESAYRFSTRCARAGVRHGGRGRNEPVQQPIVQSSIFDLGGTADAEAIFPGGRKGYAYSRFGNPTVETLAHALADLEGGAEALVTSSGNAAVLCAVTCALHGRSGPLVTHHDIYCGSFELLRILSTTYRLPLEIVDSAQPECWLKAVAKAGAVLVETPSNPLMRLIDLAQTVEWARSGGAPVIVDNTVATPFNQRPFAFGVDWIVHSTTKYLNGHSDLIGGCLIRREPLSTMHRTIHKNLGGTVNASEAALVLRGLRTFALRMEAHNRNGARLASWLLSRAEIARVHYPGLPSHPQAKLFRTQMTHGGGLLSFELAGGEAAAARFFDRLNLIIHAVSLGGSETLVTRPAKSSHRGMTAEARRQAGVSESLIRLAAGIEDADDLIADLEQAIAQET